MQLDAIFKQPIDYGELLLDLYLLLLNIITFSFICLCQKPEKGKLVFKVKHDFEYL